MDTKQTQTNEILKHPFPQQRPDVKIAESDDRITEVDCPELQWWFTTPQMGEHYFIAAYDALTLELAEVKEIIATAPATVQDIDCVELRVKEWAVREGWPTGPELMYATLEKHCARWVAIFMTSEDGRKIFDAVGTDFFEDQWGGAMTRRRIVDDGRYQRQSDGSYKLTDAQGLGAGTYDVTIGENTFHCLRVLDPDLDEPNGGELNEVYIESEGRTVLHRRYDGRSFRGSDLVSKFPDNRRIIINDVVYVHHDCSGRANDDITLTGLGMNGKVS